MAMSIATKRHKVVIAESVHPEYRQTLATYMHNLDARALTLPTPQGFVDPDDLKRTIDDQTACVVVQHPNFFGCLEEVETLARIAHERGALFIVSFDPIAPACSRARRYKGRHCHRRGPVPGQPRWLPAAYPGILRLPRNSHKMPAGCRSDGDRQGKARWVLTLQTASSTSAAKRRRATSAPTRDFSPCVPRSTWPRWARKDSRRQPSCARANPIMPRSS
jgi:glycine dehydrogenase subunit 1